YRFLFYQGYNTVPDNEAYCKGLINDIDRFIGIRPRIKPWAGFSYCIRTVKAREYFIIIISVI
ncbi:MAG TPA: hypothetical protein PKU88_10985, partial [Bacillota bacterium]|nr:hypothetical protein [Bacillota bacterium]